MGSDRVGPQAIREYLNQLRPRYMAADRATKRQLLDEACLTTGYHRKAVIRALRRRAVPVTRRGGRLRRYGPTVVGPLRAIWEAAGYPWSTRLKALLDLWLPWARRRFRLTPEVEARLRTISPRQIDRCLQADKRRGRSRYGRTKPGTLLKHQIPLKTDRWDVEEPGYTEIDLVNHSGDRADGPFVYSLDLTDILTTWVETRALLGKHQVDVQVTLEELRQALPFALLGIDSDNGGEFINQHLHGYCRREGIQFTRGRPYKKDDNAHIEQKNWTHVRKLLGYARYDTLAAVEAINAVYAELRLLQNFFMPSVKLVEKRRVGSRIRRRYDAPRTPLDRLQACPSADPAVVRQLLAHRAQLDPFALAERVGVKLERVYALANHRVGPAGATRPVDAAGRVEAQSASTTPLENRPDRGFPQPPPASSSRRSSVTRVMAR